MLFNISVTSMPMKRGRSFNRIHIMDYAKALDVLEKTCIIASTIFGDSKNSARATRTISITYSTIVWPFSSFLSLFILNLSHALSREIIARRLVLIFMILSGEITYFFQAPTKSKRDLGGCLSTISRLYSRHLCHHSISLQGVQ